MKFFPLTGVRIVLKIVVVVGAVEIV